MFVLFVGLCFAASVVALAMVITIAGNRWLS